MLPCFDATRFGLGLKDTIELVAQQGFSAFEYAFEPFSISSSHQALSNEESNFLLSVKNACQNQNVKIACIRLQFVLALSDKECLDHFEQLLGKLTLVANILNCNKLIFTLRPENNPHWISQAEQILSPIASSLKDRGINLLLSLATPHLYQGKPLKQWRPCDPQEWRDLLAGCPGLSLSFSVADCIWQGIDYLKILPGLISAIEHVEANDIEVNRDMLADSGLFGPLWWRYRIPGKGQVDWCQLIEALKLYDYKGSFSIHLDDEFIDEDINSLTAALEGSTKMLLPLLRS